MYYDVPNVQNYIHWMTRYRLPVIVLFCILLSLFIVFGRFNFSLNDEDFWLKNSKELARTEAMGIAPQYVMQLTLHPEVFDMAAKQQMAQIHETLQGIDGIQEVDSLFSRYYVWNEGENDESCLIKALPLADMDVGQIEKLINVFEMPYRRYASKDLKQFHYFIYSEKRLETLEIPIPFAHELSKKNEIGSQTEILAYLLGIALAVIIVFRLIFHNFIASISAIIVISLTLLLTFELIYLITGLTTLHLALGLIIVAIALVDFLYFYYRWHVAHYKNDTDRAISKALNRNLVPALWTTIITVAGLGGLLLSDSLIVKMLSISIIGASLFAYLVNMTLLIAILSYFSVSHPRVVLAKPVYRFVNPELKYSPRVLRIIIVATLGLLAAGFLTFIARSGYIFTPPITSKAVTLSVPFETIDTHTVKAIETFEHEVSDHFEGVIRVESVVSLLRLIEHHDEGVGALDESSILRGLFFIDMYDMQQRYISDDGTLSVILHIDKATDSSKLISFIRHYKELELYFSDIDMLLGSAKLQQMIILALSLLTALMTIGLIMGAIFKERKMVFVGFIVNAIPIAWFGLLVELLHIPINLEMLIAMSIAIGLGSDATVHFAFKFFRARYFGRTRKHSLELMFFYAGVPVIIGSMILIGVMTTLTLSNIESLRQIGEYGSVLIFFSLMTDLMILPVLLLKIDRFDRREWLRGGTSRAI